MADISAFTSVMPKLPGFFTLTNVLLVFIIGGSVLLIGGGLLIWWLWKKRYNLKIEIFRTINGRTSRVATWKGYNRRIGTANDYWLQIWWSKLVLPRPLKYIDKNTVWYLAREDGEFINFDLGDLDDLQRKMGVHFDHQDMRLARASIQKILRDNYKKDPWYVKYAGIIAMVIVVVVMIVCLVLILYMIKDLVTKIGDLSATVNGYVEVAKGIAQTQQTSGMKPL